MRKIASKLTVLVVCLYVVSGALADSEIEDADKRSWIEAPKDRVGVRVEDWTEYLGPDYSIDEPSAFKNRHSGDPMAVLCLVKGKTEARFMVNLTTNEHFLLDVQSADEDFLREMGITDIPIKEGSELKLTDDWDGGQNELNVQLTASGRLAAIWFYYLD